MTWLDPFSTVNLGGGSFGSNLGQSGVSAIASSVAWLTGGDVALNAATVPFNNSAGSIPFNAGVWTLTAGVTYDLEANVPCVSASNWFKYYFADATTGAILPGTAEGYSQAGTSSGAGSGPAGGIYTPVTNQTIKVTIATGLTGSAGGSTNSGAPRSYAKVIQLTASMAHSPIVVESPITLTATTANPTKATTRELDYIRITDDGSGICACDMRYYASNAAGANVGSGTNLIEFPGGYKFDTIAHPPNVQTGNLSGWFELTKILPSSQGIIYQGNTEPTSRCVAIPHSATQFKVMTEFGLNGGISAWYFWASNLWAISINGTSVQLSFRFKKG